MRSRYAAYALSLWEYVLETWHPDTRPAQIDSTTNPHWVGLQIIARTAGEPGDVEGTVEFVARCRTSRGLENLRETSHFVYEEGHWYYVSGEIARQATSTTTGRNQPCSCGSGIKYKRCCGKH